MSPLFNYSTLSIKRLLIVIVSITKLLLYAGMFYLFYVKYKYCVPK